MLIDDVAEHLNSKFAIALIVPLVEGIAFLEAVQAEEKHQQTQSDSIGEHQKHNHEYEEVEGSAEISPAVDAGYLLNGSHHTVYDAMDLLDCGLDLRELLVEALLFLFDSILVVPLL